MSVLVDSGPIIAFLHRRDRLHAEATRILGPVLDGEAGDAVVSDYVVDEVVTFLVARGASARDLDKALAFLVGADGEPGPLTLRQVTPEAFAEAVRLVRRHRERRLSFTDCTSLALMARLRVDQIATFDAGFDGLAPRLGVPGLR